MFDNIARFFKKLANREEEVTNSKDAAKERLHLVLMQDRANVSADFLELMKQEIIEVIKKYIEVQEEEIDVRLKNKVEEDGTHGAPFLYANIPVLNIRNEMKKEAELTSIKKEEEKEGTEKKEAEDKETKKADEKIEKEEKEDAEKNKDEVVEEIIEEIEKASEEEDSNEENSEGEESTDSEENEDDKTKE
ncbi:MAG: cell division topological specificity factor MinE [Oscillospiraceae bacterium]|nr:cell division topological specificity factor MinE [Oscillospiraceae bacterium]